MLVYHQKSVSSVFRKSHSYPQINFQYWVKYIGLEATLECFHQIKGLTLITMCPTHPFSLNTETGGDTRPCTVSFLVLACKQMHSFIMGHCRDFEMPHRCIRANPYIKVSTAQVGNTDIALFIKEHVGEQIVHCLHARRADCIHIGEQTLHCLHMGEQTLRCLLPGD